jgi:hypothetical protein
MSVVFKAGLVSAFAGGRVLAEGIDGRRPPLAR